MNGELSQYGGWFAILYLIIKDVIIPLVRKTVPAKVKADSEQQRHTQIMEEKKINSEIATQERLAKSIEELAKTQAVQTELFRVQDGRVAVIEADVKDIKQAIIPRRVKKAN